MSLLTDLEIRTIAGQDPSTASLEILVDTATELTLKAVAEWLGEYCDNPKHESQAKRIACIRCLWELQDAGTFGKMPGEE